MSGSKLCISGNIVMREVSGEFLYFIMRIVPKKKMTGGTPEVRSDKMFRRYLKDIPKISPIYPQAEMEKA